jgi:hypothetical protein
VYIRVPVRAVKTEIPDRGANGGTPAFETIGEEEKCHAREVA